MKKTKFLAAVVALLTLGMTACGGNGGNTKSSSAKHVHSWGEWQEVTAPTCEGKGSEKRTCSTCNEVETRDKDAIGHLWGDAQDVPAADATVIGYQKFACTRAGCTGLKYEVSVKDGAGFAEVADGRLSSTPAGFIKLKATDSFEFSINSNVAGTGKLYLRATMDNWGAQSDNKGRTLFSGKNGSEPVEKEVPNLKISVNNTALTVTNKKTMEQMLPAIDDAHPAAGNQWSAVGDILYGDDLAVAAGPNVIKYERVDSFNPAVSHLVFIFTPTQA